MICTCELGESRAQPPTRPGAYWQCLSPAATSNPSSDLACPVRAAGPRFSRGTRYHSWLWATGQNIPRQLVTCQENPFTAVLQAAKAPGCLVYVGGRCLMLHLSPQDTAHGRRGENPPGDVGSRKWDRSLLETLWKTSSRKSWRVGEKKTEVVQALSTEGLISILVPLPHAHSKWMDLLYVFEVGRATFCCSDVRVAFEAKSDHMHCRAGEKRFYPIK